MAKLPRVLQVYRTFFPDTQGGAEETIKQLSIGLGHLGVPNRVFVPSPNPVPKIVNVQGVEVVRSKLHFEIASCGFALTSFSEFRRQIEWADVIHYHFPWPFADLLDLLVSNSKPKLVTYHSDIVRQQGLMAVYRPLMTRFLEGMDRVIATSAQYLETSDILSALGSVDVVPIGIDEKSYVTPDEEVKREVRAKFGTGYFFFVGMLRYYKGLHLLIDACKGQKFRVLIAGTGPEEKSLRNLIEAEGVDNVELIGRVSDSEKIALIDNSLAMVFPSHLRSEAFGVTLLEGLMRAKPLITAEVGTGTSYVNSDGQTGFVVPPNDALALRQAMVQMLEPQTSVRMQVEARKRFERLFTADKMAMSYSKIYRQLYEASP